MEEDHFSCSKPEVNLFLETACYDPNMSLFFKRLVVNKAPCLPAGKTHFEVKNSEITSHENWFLSFRHLLVNKE